MNGKFSTIRAWTVFCTDVWNALFGPREPLIPAWLARIFAAAIASAKLTAAVPTWDTFSDTWVATDGLGRPLPTFETVGQPKTNKHVGLFYFLWLTGKGPVYDLTKILAANPANPTYGPLHAFHFWGQPLFGYYRSDDPWGIRKHAQMLADAGVDVIIFDVTNAYTYDETYRVIGRVFSEMRGLGLATPQVAFIAHASSGRTVTGLYDRFYAPGLFPDLWFRWQGNPLMLAAAEGLAPPVAQFFTLRQSWAWSDPKGWFKEGRDKWPWLDHYPQKAGWHDRPDQPEAISVCVAQHPTANIGRSFHAGRQPPPGQTATDLGLCFEEQWRQALSVNPPFIFVTGWNEWIAQRFTNAGGIKLMGRPLAKGDTFFVDQYNQEFSRDVEPMSGGHGDHYYYQMIAHIRRYKGVRPLPPVVSQPIAMDGRFADWNQVTPEFRDTLGDVVHRQHPGWQGQPALVNRTGRNDLEAARVSSDGQRLYFYVRARAPLTPPTGTNWMLLFIDADRNATNGWLGYDFVVNRSSPGPRRAILEQYVGGVSRWGRPIGVDFAVAGREMELAVPRSALRLPPGPAVVDFKWADNIGAAGDWSCFTLEGDAAPNDRFNYRAQWDR